MASDPRTSLAALPQVDQVLRLDAAADVIAEHGRPPFADAVRAELDAARERIRAGEPAPSADELVTAAATRLRARRTGRVRRVINATGVVVHTNLGRAPLSMAARQAVLDAAGYATVEYDLETGARGSRTAHVGALAAELADTEAATVVNNGAAALLLVLAALAAGREVVVSRGELIEIGGSFRLPEIMEVSGARLVEVGTSNRTRLGDYEAAIGEDTALLLKVHRSNHRIVGFTEDVPPGPLADLAHHHDLPLVHDLGSGLIHAEHGGSLSGEPAVRASVAAGADLVVFSGDKLLGGPQAGILAGRGDLVERCRRHPLARAIRIDKLQRAALESTLASHLRSADPVDLPTVAMLRADPATLAGRARSMAAELASALEAGRVVEVAAVELPGVAGGGALPGVELPSAGLALTCADADELAARLRGGEIPVIARVEAGRVLVDLRTVPPAQDGELVDLLLAAMA